MPDLCKLCHAQGPFVSRSHVIPRWMYDMLPIDTRRFRIMSSHPTEFEQKSQTGIYGSFVCRNCEDLFALWDNYAAELLRNNHKVSTTGWKFGSYDYDKLIRFYLSVFWRMGACTHHYFETVPFDESIMRIGNALIADEKSCLHAFDVIPSYSNHLLSYGVVTPIKIQIEAVPYWQIYMPRFQALIKTDDLPGARCFRSWKLRPGCELLMLDKNFKEFGEEEIVEQVFRKNLEKKECKVS